MRKFIVQLVFLSVSSAALAQNVGIGTQAPHSSAQLDVFSDNRGLLAPRVALTNAFLSTPVASPAVGLLVWNTNASVANGQGVGFYYWAGSRWQKLAANADGWMLTGNGFIDTSVNFIGTTLANPTQTLRFKVGGQWAGSLEATNENLYFGTQAGGKTLLGSGFDFPERNTFVGFGAGRDNVRGTSSTYLGAAAGRSSAGGFGNTMVGAYAGAAADSSNRNTYVGFSAGGGIGQGHQGVMIGFSAGSFQASGNGALSMGNVAVGYEAANNLRQSSGTVAIGRMAGRGNVFSIGIGNYNVFVGDSSGYLAQGAERNVLIGRQSGANLTSGSRNVMVGEGAGLNFTTGAGNVMVGEGARGSSATLQNATAIGARAEAGASNTMVLGSIAGVNGALSNVNVGIGTTTPVAPLHVMVNSTGVLASSNSTLVVERSGSNNHLSMLIDNNREGALIFGKAGSTQPPFDGGIFYNTNGTGAMQFRNAGGLTRLVIHNDGNMGIGTSTYLPNHKLYLLDGTTTGLSANANSTLVIEKGGANNYLTMLGDNTNETGIYFARAGTGGGPTNGAITFNAAATPGGIQFRTGNVSNRMAIASNGNIGMGTAEPDYKLHVRTNLSGNSGIAGGILIENTSTLNPEAAISFKNAGTAGTGTSQWMMGLNASRNFSFAYGTEFLESNTKFLIDSTGRVGIGLTNPTFQLQLSTNSAAKPGSNTWTVSSDERLKKDIHPFTDGLDILQKIDPIWFTYTGAENHPQEQFVGTTAQALEKVAPYMVTTLKEKSEVGDKLLGVDYGPMQFVLINAIKEQQKMLEAQQQKIEQLENMLEQKVKKKARRR